MMKRAVGVMRFMLQVKPGNKTQAREATVAGVRRRSMLLLGSMQHLYPKRVSGEGLGGD